MSLPTWESDRFNRIASFLLSGFVMYFCCWNCISRPFRCKLLKTALDHDFFRFPFDGTKFCIDPAPPSTSTNDLASMKLLERKCWFGGPDADAIREGTEGLLLLLLAGDGCCWWCWCCCWYLSIIACVRTLYEGWYWSVDESEKINFSSTWFST